MKTKSFSELRRETSDNFSYILVFCPNFPSGTESTTTKEFEKLISLIDSILQQAKGDDAKQWLRVCLQEVRQSWKHYADGRRHEGAKMIQRAEEHFKNAFSKKPVEARFVAGESGAAFDSKKGFAE